MYNAQIYVSCLSNENAMYILGGEGASEISVLNNTQLY